MEKEVSSTVPPPVGKFETTSKADVNEERKSRMRYIILTISVLSLSSIMSNIVCFNFTVLCMPSTFEEANENHTYIGYSKHERTVLFSSVAIGALVSVVPISYSINAIGTRKVFMAAGIMSAVSTGLIPILSRVSIKYFIFLRFVQGMAFAACMPTVGSVTANWASLAQNGLFMGVLTTFGQVSSIFSMPISGQLCTTELGWASVYYLHSLVGLVLFVIFFIVYRNEPGEHSLVTKSELSAIRSGKSAVNLQKYDDDGKRKVIPYLSILTTPSVWGVWIGALGDLIAVQLIHTFSPLYIRQVLGYSVQKTGLTAALPVLFQFFVKVFAGHSSDRIRGISETTKLRIYNSIALGASAAFMAGLAYVPKEYSVLGVVLMTLSNAMFGFNGGGFNKCASLVSRQYSHFVLANIQFIWCLSMLISPILVNAILVSGSLSEWRIVFLSHAALLVMCNVVFCLLATAKPANWTDPQAILNPAKKNRSVIFSI